MGLLDILNGMQNGPRGQRQPGSSSGGMSPMMIALLGLLAYKAFKGRAGQPADPGGTGRPVSVPNPTAPSGGLSDILGGLLGGRSSGAPSGATGSGTGGSLADLIPGGLGSLFTGAAAGSVLSGGLANLIKDVADSGHRGTAQSWVGSGPNQEIPPNDLEKAIGSDALDALSQHTGIGRQELLSGLSQHLPEFVDRLTPDGRLPTDQEASQMV